MTEYDPNDPVFQPTAQGGDPTAGHTRMNYGWGLQSPAQKAMSTPAVDNMANFPNKKLPNPRSRPDLNNRVYQMLQAGGQWLPLQTLYGLADSGIADDELLQLTEHMRRLTIDGVKGSTVQSRIGPAQQGLDYQKQANKALAQQGGMKDDILNPDQPGVTAAIHGTAAVSAAQELIHKADDGFKHFFDDPVLQKHPSALMVIQSYLSNVLGPAPVAGDTLKHAQQQIQLMGFGRDLRADGTMSPGWSGAIAEYRNGVFRSQLSGNKPGSISVDHALKALSAITPGEAWPALFNFIMAGPKSIRTMVADVVGSAGGLVAGAMQGVSEGNLDFLTKKEGSSWQRDIHGAIGSTIENIGSENAQTAEQNVGDFQDNFGRHLLEDGINAIMLGSMIGAGSRFWDAAAMEKLASSNAEKGAALNEASAARGPGVIAHTLSSDTPGTSVWSHLPIMKHIGPIVGDLSTEGEGAGLAGKYYKLRSFAHTPYTWVSGQGETTALQGAIGTATRLSDLAFQKSLILGGEARALGQVEQNFLGDKDATLAAKINQHNTPIDELNDALGSFNVLGTHPASLDDLMFIYGGAGAHALGQTTSQEIGRSAAGMQKGMINSLHEVGISEGVSRLYHGQKIPYISKSFGGSDNFGTFIWDKIYNEAAKFAAQNEYERSLVSDGLPVQLSSSERVEKIRSMATSIRNDPEKVQKALTDLLSQGGGNELYVRLHEDRILDPDAWNPRLVKDRIAASNHVRDNIIPWTETHIASTDEAAGIKVYRHSGDSIDTSINRPQGAYVGHSPEDIAFMHGQSGPLQEHTIYPGNPLNIPLHGGDVPSIEVIRHFAGDEAANTLHNLMHDHDYKGMADWSRDNLGIATTVRTREQYTGQVADSIAGKLARQGGHDVIHFNPEGAAVGESAILNKSALTPNDRLERVFPELDDPANIGIIPKDTGYAVQDAHAFNSGMEAELKSIRAREAYSPDDFAYAQRQTSVGEEHINPATPSPGPKPTAQEMYDWNKRMDAHLQEIYNIRGAMMPQTFEDKLRISKELAERHLPIELVPHNDAPAAVIAAMQELDDQGYKLVSIKDMGHKIHDVGPMEELKGGLTFRRKLAEHIGINPDNIFDATIGHEAQNQILTEVKKAVDDKGVMLGPGQTPASIIKILRSHGVLPEEDILKGKFQQFFGTDKRLRKLLESDVEALETQLPLRDARRKDIVKALMDPKLMSERDPASYDLWESLRTAMGNTEIDTPWMSERDANLIAHAIVKGYAHVPTAFTGLNHIEDMFRGIGFMGLGMDNKLGYAMANLPNKLIQLRNQIRFDLSPMFDFRRIYKTNIKMATEGISPAWDPIKSLVKDGSWDQARQALMDARPQHFTAEALGYADNADRYLASAGVFHYNQLGYETWAAYQLKLQGMKPEQIDKTLTKLFQYGNRSGMERSMNFLFFPFSFEKSLYKVMGSYILDKPAQRLLLTHAMAAYDQFNKEHMDGSNPLATSFYNKHLPIFAEASRINAFTSGISLGEPGGINRPLLNLFLPQSWSPKKASMDLLEEYIPALKDFSRIYKESLETVHITRNWANNLYNDTIGNNPATMSNPRNSTLTAGEDLSAGFDMYRALQEKYKAHIENGDITPVDPEWGKFAGKKMTNQLLRQMVHAAHPAYTAEGAATYVIANQQNFDDYVDSLRGKPLSDGKFHGPARLPDGSLAYPYVKGFGEAVNSLDYDLHHTNNPSQYAKQTESLRAAAMYIAEADPQFYELYPKTFGRILGPLEAVQQ